MSMPMAKFVASIAVAGVRIVGRAFARSLQQEYQASQQAAKARATSAGTSDSAAANAYTGLTLQEAMQILNVKDIKDMEAITKNYDHLFSVNEKVKGGSLYIQSKIVRAKERIDKELQMGEAAQTEKHSQQTKPES